MWDGNGDRRDSRRRKLAIVGRDTIARRAFLADYDIRNLPDETKRIFGTLWAEGDGGPAPAAYIPCFYSLDLRTVLARLMRALQVPDPRRAYFEAAFEREVDLRIHRSLRSAIRDDTAAADRHRLPALVELVRQAALRDVLLAVLKTELAAIDVDGTAGGPSATGRRREIIVSMIALHELRAARNTQDDLHGRSAGGSASRNDRPYALPGAARTDASRSD